MTEAEIRVETGHKDKQLWPLAYCNKPVKKPEVCNEN
jgi:hypothetical protein